MPAFVVVIVVAVSLGFGRTVVLPTLRGTFSRPWFVYLHGTLFVVWVSLLAVQVWLISRRQVRLHQRLGMLGAVLVPLMAVSGVVVSVWATNRDVALGQPGAIVFFFGLLMDMLMFFAFGCAALLTRRRPALHKRLIVFATLAILGAAIGRIPVVGNAANALTVVLVFAVVAYDLTIDRRVRAVTLIGGALFLAGVYTETAIGETDAWRRVGPRVLKVLTLP